MVPKGSSQFATRWIALLSSSADSGESGLRSTGAGVAGFGSLLEDAGELSWYGLQAGSRREMADSASAAAVVATSTAVLSCVAASRRLLRWWRRGGGRPAAAAAAAAEACPPAVAEPAASPDKGGAGLQIRQR